MDGRGNSISKRDIEFIKEKLLALQYKPFEKKFEINIKAVGYLTYLFQKIGIRPIIVGGHAVELYTAGHYTTVDVDIVLSGRDAAKEILERVGFTKHSGERHWYHKELGLPIEIPDDLLAGSMDKIIEVTFGDGFFVFVIGIEDLILDRARAAVYWDSASDREWALLLLNAQWNDIDFDYLINEAIKEPQTKQNNGVYNLILELIDETKNYNKHP
ncbi:MAG: UbiD family decarboxylase [Peptococcaceae bacterium BRH_c4b]|nr:MAG: UbiD family decarboxylase [Peptococcaceae bacterium BRH_c4b]